MVASSVLSSVQAQSRDFLIVGDLSGSVQGFARKSPKQMETIFRVLYTTSTSSQLARMPGERDVVQLIGLDRVSLFANPNSYKGQTTPLAETIKRATASYASVGIVTDGMQSDNLYMQLQQAIVPLAQEGYGVWILLLSLPFEGKYDLEQPLNAKEQYDEMLACVKQQNSSWNVSIDPKARHTIEFAGERPLLLLLFDRDPVHGREHALSIASGIENNVKRKPEIVELSPLYLREYVTEALEPKTLGVTVVSGEGTSKRIVTDPQEGGSTKTLIVRLAWKREQRTISQPFEEQWTLSRTKRTAWSDVQILKGGGSDKSPGSLKLVINSDLTWGEWFWHLFSRGPVMRDQPFEFSIGSAVDQPVDGWWNQWNEDTTWKCPQKVFKLKSLVERIAIIARDRITGNPPHETHTLKLQVGAS